MVVLLMAISLRVGFIRTFGHVLYRLCNLMESVKLGMGKSILALDQSLTLLKISLHFSCNLVYMCLVLLMRCHRHTQWEAIE